jgi:predicted kinase
MRIQQKFALTHSFMQKFIFSALPLKQGCNQLREPFADFVKAELNPNILLITCGLPGTWKTETSQEISKIHGYPILRTDLIRLEVLKNEDIFDAKIAGNMSKRELVYDEMFRRAENLAQKGKGVILDATFVTQKLRRRAAEIAAKTKIPFVILQTSCSEDASIARILRRTKENYESNALTKEAYIANKKKFEPVDLYDLKQRHPNLEVIHLTVDTEYDNPEDWYIIGKEVK